VRPASDTHARTRGWVAHAPTVLLLMAFLAPGAWLITRLPPIPASKALTVVAYGLWLVAFATGLVGFSRPDRRILLGLGALGVSIVVSYLAGGSLFAVALYDLFADMPLIQWIGFVAVFVLAVGMRLDAHQLRRSLSVVVAAGTVVALGMIAQQSIVGVAFAFGSTAYSVTALVPLVPISVGLGTVARGRARMAGFLAAIVIAVALAFFSGSVMGGVAAVFALVVSVPVYVSASGGAARGMRVTRTLALAAAALMTAGLLFVQIPALSGSFVNPESVAPLGTNVVSRAYLWEGAQAMVIDRPLVGYGPSGYRTAAVEYLEPEALQYGADAAGNADPTVYSPQSPHSLFWEIATRLGILGVLAFGAMLVVWMLVLREALALKDAPAGLRAALAAGFISALFALSVNPVVFPIGLFAPAAAGLAVGAVRDGKPGSSAKQSPPRPVWALAVAGVLVIVVAGWLYAGEWRAYSARSDNPAENVTEYEASLRTIPGHPMTERRLLENRLLLAEDDADLRSAQEAVDAAPGYMAAFAPNMVNFAAYSLTQAERTGRTDVSWEADLLADAASKLPTIPSLVAEQLHLAVVSGDIAAVRAALPAAREWGRPYPYTERYLLAAEEMTR